MRVMVLGGGGREHALVHALARSEQVDELFCVPGNAGTAALARNLPANLDDLAALVDLARSQRVDLTVVGPEGPLCAGIVDRFTTAGLPLFGPSASAARLEGDKAFAKRLMKRAAVPTAEARIFDSFEEARAYVGTRDHGVVVKASGLAAGKGVSVCPDPADGLLALERIMVDHLFGDAGRTVVVEELLKGEELSVMALVDGTTIYLLDTAQDHKALGDGDTGPNTGGMGAYSPAPIATPQVLATVERDVLVPIVDALRREGTTYRGVLYAGLMLTPAGPKVLEFNCRFGDPEAQVLLPRLRTDLAEVLLAVVQGRLDQVELVWDPRPAVCVVLASAGYPGSFQKGKAITGLEEAASMEEVIVFHAGTRGEGQNVVTSGGRVLGVTALGDDLADARRRAYAAVDRIRFDNLYFRRDIGERALRRDRSSRSVTGSA